MRWILMMALAVGFGMSTDSAQAGLSSKGDPTSYYMNRYNLPDGRVLFEGLRYQTQESSYFFSESSDGQALCRLVGGGKFVSARIFESASPLLKITPVGEFEFDTSTYRAYFSVICAAP